MDRRSFIRSIGLAPIAAALPLPTAAKAKPARLGISARAAPLISQAESIVLHNEHALFLSREVVGPIYQVDNDSVVTTVEIKPRHWDGKPIPGKITRNVCVFGKNWDGRIG